MPFKLNLAQPSAELTLAEKSRKEVSSKNGYESPVGWWKVSTEGDVEGRSIKQLGTYYGHVAEIALSLAKESFYVLTFTTTKPPAVDDFGGLVKSVRRKYKASAYSVWVGFKFGVICGCGPSSRATNRMVRHDRNWGVRA